LLHQQGRPPAGQRGRRRGPLHPRDRPRARPGSPRPPYSADPRRQRRGGRGVEGRDREAPDLPPGERPNGDPPSRRNEGVRPRVGDEQARKGDTRAPLPGGRRAHGEGPGARGRPHQRRRDAIQGGL
ncbi:MAG: hypothetical protein AVDCRST_MAG25-1943, partial [uncultured Rubrobacteraceae bacterium]